MTAPPTKPPTDAEIVLARCRTATLRLKLAEAAITQAALPLSKGWISVPGAIAALRDEGVLGLVLPHLDDAEPTDTGRSA